MAAHHCGHTIVEEENNESHVRRPRRASMNRNRNFSSSVHGSHLESQKLLDGSADESDGEENADTVIDMSALVPIPGGMSSPNNPNYHFVINGNTWSWLYDNAPTPLLEQILVKATIFSRMSPEGKMQIVEALQVCH